MSSDLIRGMRGAPEGRDPARAQGVLMGAPRAAIWRPRRNPYHSFRAASPEATQIRLAFQPGGSAHKTPEAGSRYSCRAARTRCELPARAHSTASSGAAPLPHVTDGPDTRSLMGQGWPESRSWSPPANRAYWERSGDDQALAFGMLGRLQNAHRAVIESVIVRMRQHVEAGPFQLGGNARR